MSDLWVSDKTIRKWLLPRRSVDSESEVQEMLCGHFQQKYDGSASNDNEDWLHG